MNVFIIPPIVVDCRLRRRSLFGLALTCLLAACETSYKTGEEEWAAHGFLSPTPTGESEVIGVYNARKECETAAEEWMSRQVAGVPVFADCYPVDKH